MLLRKKKQTPLDHRIEKHRNKCKTKDCKTHRKYMSIRFDETQKQGKVP
jgi:hypothetical protein